MEFGWRSVKYVTWGHDTVLVVVAVGLGFGRSFGWRSARQPGIDDGGVLFARSLPLICKPRGIIRA